MTSRMNIIAAVAGVIVFFLLLSLAQEVNRQWQAQREIQRLSDQVRQQQAAVVELENLNRYFRTDDFQERLAREKLNYRAPGEQVVLIPDAELRPESDSTEITQEPQILSVPRLWWDAFFAPRQ